MGINSQFTNEEIRRMRLLRQYGASLSEIAGIFGSNESTIYYHVRDVKAVRDGHEIELVKENLWQLLPQFPWEDEGLPLPRWLVRYLRQRQGKAGETD